MFLLSIRKYSDVPLPVILAWKFEGKAEVG